MPELPDVEVLRRYIDATSLYKEITDVDARAPYILGDLDGEALRDGLRGHAFEDTWRYGKYCFVHLDNGRWLELHFGMSGDLTYFRDMEDDPEYDQCLFSFANGYHLAYVAPRKLGEIDLIDDARAFVRGKQLGPDVYDDAFDLDRFRELLSNRRGMIKSALMDQALMAGVGNVYSDEVLFQAKIHPRTKISALSEAQTAQIYETLQTVLQTAIDHQADPSDYPDTYLTPHRAQNGVCPLCGESLVRVKVSGRSAYFCRNRQGDAPD